MPDNFFARAYYRLASSLSYSLKTAQTYDKVDGIEQRLSTLDDINQKLVDLHYSNLNGNQISHQYLQSLSDQIVAQAQSAQLIASNARADAAALRDYVMGFQSQMQLEMHRVRLSAASGGDMAQTVSSQSAAKYLDLLEGVLTGEIMSDGAQSSVGEQPFDPLRRSLGRDWPTSALTMIGGTRMRNLRQILELALQNGVEGDFIETGVWRGGACIYAKAIFEAHGQGSRRVFVADSFRGLPPPNTTDYPQDAGDTHHTYEELAISRDQVTDSFRRFGLLDDRVVFIEGWFSDTLPKAPVDRLCVLRLDGDLHESTIVALKSLYDKVSPGGYVIIDDYLLAPCAEAVNDFRAERGIDAPMHQVDGAAVWWQVEGRDRKPARRGRSPSR